MSCAMSSPPAQGNRRSAAGRDPRFRQSTGFQARLTIVFTILVSVPLLVILLASYRIALNHTEAATREKSLAVAAATAAALDRQIGQARERFLAAVAAGPAGPGLPAGPLALVAVETGGPGVAVLRQADAAGTARRRLPDRAAMAGYRDAAAAGPGPVVLSPTLRDRDGPYFHLATRLPDGRLAVGVLDGGFVRSLQQAARFGDRGQAVILDAEGRAIFDPRAAPELDPGAPPVLPRPRTAAEVAPGVHFVEDTWHGTLRLGSHVAVAATGWTVAVLQPKVELQTRAWQAAKAQYLPMLAVIALCSLLASALAREIVRPVRRVTDIAERIAAGDFSQRVGPIASPAREFEVFGAAFDRMIAELARQNAELERAAAEARAASTAKSLFLASVSHELRTPINGVVGLIDAVRETEPDTGRRALLDHAAGSARVLNGLLSHILELSRLEHGQVRAQPRDFAPRALFAEIGQLFAPEAGAKGLNFELDLAAGLPDRLVADPDRLRHVLFNLVANAVKFTESGGVRVSARTGPGPAGGEALLIEIADTGAGIPEAVQARVFETFFQVDGSYNRRHGGLGLGLAIGKRLVELMGGTIRFTSAPETGTRFSLAIPVGRQAQMGARQRGNGQ